MRSNSKINLLLFLFVTLFSTKAVIQKRYIDFQQRFLERRKERQIKDDRIALLDQYVLRNTETVDGIIHYRNIDDSSNIKLKLMKSAIEDDFRRLIAMKGMKYNYKRDMYWRTWRNVLSEEGNQEFVCYKCNNPVKVGSVRDQNCGTWTIEEGSPPCPFEFYSMLDDQRLCGANYKQFKDIRNPCPLTINFKELNTCDNPIETVFRFTKMYGVAEKYNNIICAGTEFCEIYTRYELLPQQVIFRIINSTNEVMYSRIMKPNNVTYICVEDCGHLDKITNKVIKADKPLKLDLLAARNKRDDDIVIELNEAESPFIARMGKRPLEKLGINGTNSNLNISKHNSIEFKGLLDEVISIETVTLSQCQQIKNQNTEASFDDEDLVY